jgi:hypothetical protein
VRRHAGDICNATGNATAFWNKLTTNNGFWTPFQVRPIHHRLEERVRAHILLCMLAYYVEWHMREAWRPILFSDEEQEAKRTRDPVAPAKRSEAALRKVHSRRLDDGTVAHSFDTLLDELGTITRSTMRRKNAAHGEPFFTMRTTPSALHRRALEALDDAADRAIHRVPLATRVARAQGAQARARRARRSSRGANARSEA